MFRFQYLRTLLAAALLAGAAGAAQAQSAPHQSGQPASAGALTPPDKPPLSSALTGRLLYELLAAEISFSEGDQANAARVLLGAAQREGDPALYQRAVEMATASRNGAQALRAASAWRQAFPSSAPAVLYELQVLVLLGRVADTEKPIRDFLAMRASQAEQIEFLTALPFLYGSVADKAQAAQVVERALSAALDKPALAPATRAAVGRLRLMAGDKAGALLWAALGLRDDPGADLPALLALQLLELGVLEAESLVTRYLAMPQAQIDAQLRYARYLARRQRYDEAEALLQGLTRQRPDAAEIWLVYGALLTDRGQSEKAQELLIHYLDLVGQDEGAPPLARVVGMDHARLMLAELAERRQDWTQAEKWLKAIESPERSLARHVQMARLLARQGRLDEGLRTLAAAPENSDDEAQAKRHAQVLLLQQNGRAQAALELLQEDLAADPDDETLMYETALAAERANQLDEMERLLRLVMARQPQSSSAYNALGYALVNRGVRLDEARELIEHAVRLSPDDGHIRDSLGWLEFRQGRLQVARELLMSAFAAQPEAEIAAHLGEVLWSLHERDAALDVWRQGLRLNADNEVLRQTLDRLQVQP